ncbi:MotB family protein [Rhodopseudomonas sp. NSM]|uniref:MotB family protein n=1 Tax=Rhodopseudomonas sp. NSM TaxID=3457630 RepID=UPI004035765A
MTEPSEREKPELIVIRRWSSLDDDVKGGVWKIAYADFMTAMMAFFLVMWLMNATNEETRESVASYFNPIRLTDSTPDRKGINDAKRIDAGKADEGESSKPLPETDKAAKATKRPERAQTHFDETALFRDPYAILSEIAGPPSPPTPGGTSIEASRADGLKGGEANRDPFDPISWPMASKSPVEDQQSGRSEIGSLPFDVDAAALIEGQGRRPRQGQPDATASPGKGAQPLESAAAKPDRHDDPRPVRLFADEAPKNPAPVAPPAAPTQEAAPARSNAGALQAAVAAALAPLGASRPATELRETSEGLLINLTDDASNVMFATGSARPSADLVRVLDKIAPLIARTPGQVIVRGHTDDRPYRSSTDYDNWRLSTARAHMTYHMLIRGGLEGKRVERIEGYADRRPKLPNDPSAPQNRRIEILIRTLAP